MNNKNELLNGIDNILNKWDKCSVLNRLDILNELIFKYEDGFSFSELLGDFEDLFYTRILSWFKASYKQSHGMILKIKILLLFIKSNDEYLKSFVDSNGLTVLLYIIKQDMSQNIIINLSLEICYYLCNRGREWKLKLIDSNILSSICECLLFYDSDSDIVKISQNICIDLCQGLPSEINSVEFELLNVFDNKDITEESTITILHTLLQLYENRIDLDGNMLFQPSLKLLKYQSEEVCICVSELLMNATNEKNNDNIYEIIKDYIYDLEIHYDIKDREKIPKEYLGIIYYYNNISLKKPELLKYLLSERLIYWMISLGFIFTYLDSIKIIADCLSFLMVRYSTVYNIYSFIGRKYYTTYIR